MVRVDERLVQVKDEYLLLDEAESILRGRGEGTHHVFDGLVLNGLLGTMLNGDVARRTERGECRGTYRSDLLLEDDGDEAP